MSWRTELAELLPWVTHEVEPVNAHTASRCVGYRNASRRVRSDPELRERYRCRRLAKWWFNPVSSGTARTGTYCWSHLLSLCLYGDEVEETRTQRWFDRHVDEVNTVRARHGLPPVERWCSGAETSRR